MSKPTEEYTEYHENAAKIQASTQDAIYQTYVAKSPEWHRKMTKQLLGKVDIHLLPFLVVMYLLNFLDRKYVLPGPGQVQCRLTPTSAIFHRPD